MSQIQFYKLTGDYEKLLNLGFSKCKFTGTGPIGLKIVLGLALLEELTLRQTNYFNNLIFFESQLKLIEGLDLPEVVQIIQKILEGNASHDEIEALSTSSDKFIQEIVWFAEAIFLIPGECDTIIDILNSSSFRYSLETLNLQLKIYNRENCNAELKGNKYNYPIVINLLIEDLETNVMHLYHENYKTILSENQNTAEEFIKDREIAQNDLNKLENLLIELLSFIKDRGSVDGLKDFITQLKGQSFIGVALESVLNK